MALREHTAEFLLLGGIAWAIAVATGAWILERWRFSSDLTRRLFRFAYLVFFLVSLALIVVSLGPRFIAR